MSTHQTLDVFADPVATRGENPPPAQLTVKERQALLWCSKGKTSWEIARIQNCSEATVNFHFSNIRRKFAVRSRCAAVLKAIESGVISQGSTVVRGVHDTD
ncbi:helix-turn-helix domain-containing protein [Pseudomonas sp. NPDC089569]|uniref:helix-turn-helix domain-containing protein n=1 Tax=Pseudomonas sp. NPDC089569 TaxID=3390722 RepID=UPI003CFD68E7